MMTRLLDAHRRRREATDAGFTLVEVVVALLLLGIVAASALAFFVRSMQSSSHLQRSQAAQSVATQAMELARSVSPRAANAAGVSGLLIGRAKADVDTVWSAAAPADVAQTNEKWDPAAATSVNASVPLVRTTRISDQTF